MTAKAKNTMFTRIILKIWPKRANSASPEAR